MLTVSNSEKLLP